MSNKFNVGDRVRVIADGDYLEGREGVITDFDDCTSWPWNVRFDEDVNIYNTVDLELVDRSTSTFVVYDREGADVTAMHTTLEAAVSDARGAAKECLGTFQVFKLVKSFTGVQEDVVVTEKDHN